MINLLPPNDRRQLAAARTNTLLVRYVVILPILIIAMLAEMGAVYFFMNSIQTNNQRIIAENETQAARYADVKKKGSEYKKNLLVAKSILDTQFPYTAVLTAIAQALPEGASIEQIAIDAQKLNTPSEIKMRVQSYQQAVDVKNILQKIKVNSKLLFSDAKIQITNYGDYYEATYNVTFSKEILP